MTLGCSAWLSLSKLVLQLEFGPSLKAVIAQPSALTQKKMRRNSVLFWRTATQDWIWVCSSWDCSASTTELCQASCTPHHTGAGQQSRKLNRLKTQAKINLVLISLQERASCELCVLCRAMHVVTGYYILRGNSTADWMGHIQRQ